MLKNFQNSKSKRDLNNLELRLNWSSYGVEKCPFSIWCQDYSSLMGFLVSMTLNMDEEKLIRLNRYFTNNYLIKYNIFSI